MKCFIYLFLPFIFILSCNKKTQNNSSHIQKGFISESGTYYWNLNKKIVIKNIGDGGKIFAILDKLNKYADSLDGGFKVFIELPKNPSNKQIANLIKDINNSNLGLVKIEVRGTS